MPNLSQIKRERMMAFLQKIKDEHRDDDEMLIALGEIESELNAKKYGLVWEQHEEAVDVMMQDHIPVFTEVAEKEIVAAPGEGFNFILEGDNLHSLRLLEKTHKGRIDLIYIDPPYNTGNKDFVYDDAFVDKTDLFSHSKWLSFMDKRLRVAKRLLSDRGAIFISIDDNEQAPLKMLCDEIFGSECFVQNVSWQRTYSKRNDSKGIPAEVEHILVYSQIPQWNPKRLPRTTEMNEAYKSQDGDPREWSSVTINAPGASTHQGMVYAIQHPITGNYMYPPVGRCWSFGQPQLYGYMSEWVEYELKPLDDFQKRCEICGKKEGVPETINALVLKRSLEESKTIAMERYEQGLRKEKPWPLLYFTGNGKGGIRRKQYLDTSAGRVATNLWVHAEVGHTGEATNELASIFGGKAPFDTPKPTRLIDRILEIASHDDSIILDFFAGSGTTGHGVLKYNSTHADSKRRFILCTNNEGGICETVTYPRVKTVITGKRSDGSDYAEAIAANVKYYRTDFVSKDEEYLSDALLEHIVEMIQLEHGVKIDGGQYLMVMSDEEADELQAHWNEYDDVKALYVSRNVLFTTEQNRLFANTEIHIIPDYYFNFELKEVGETW